MCVLSINSLGGIISKPFELRNRHEIPLPVSTSVHIFKSQTFFCIPTVYQQNQEITQGPSADEYINHYIHPYNGILLRNKKEMNYHCSVSKMEDALC